MQPMVRAYGLIRLSKGVVFAALILWLAALAWPAPQSASAYSSCNLTALGSTIVGRCGADRIYLAGGGRSSFGRIGSLSAAIVYTSSSMFGRIGATRFFYSTSGGTTFGRFGSLRFVAVLSGRTILGRVATSRTSCLAVGAWYFCRGPNAEALVPVAALMAPSLS
jgi:hypothetical protein